MTPVQGKSMAAAENLQAGIDHAGSPVKLLWKREMERWQPSVIPDEFVGWPEEQSASESTVALSEQPHHMFDLLFERPDATRSLADISVNDHENFAADQAKQFVGIASPGLIVGDGILLLAAEQKSQCLSSFPRFHS